MKKILLIYIVMATSNLFSQTNVGIGTATHHSSAAILDLTATDKALATTGC